MGKIKISADKLTFSPLQKIIFDEFSKDPKLKKQFYFTGGTALSAIYLHHRESEDLDFFSETDFNDTPVNDFIKFLAKVTKTRSQFNQVEEVRMYQLVRSKRPLIKLDFNYYPYKRLKKGIKISGVAIDSPYDIAVNKLQTIVSRTQIKDFVDFYFLLKQFSLWDLIYALEPKFNMEFDHILIGTAFLKIKQFDTLPKMLVPLELEELIIFYKDLAKKIGMSVVEK